MRMKVGGRLWLLALGIAAIIGVHAGLAAHVSRVLIDRYVQHEAEVTQEFLSSILAAEGTAELLFTTPSPSPALASFGAHIRSLPGVVRANVYAPDGFIRHSTEANLIGVQFSANDDLAESFKGKLVAKLEDFTGDPKDEHLALNAMGSSNLIEAYIPIPDAKGRIATVVEFYKRDTAIRESLDQVTRLMWIAAVANVLVLALVFWLAALRRRAAASS